MLRLEVEEEGWWRDLVKREISVFYVNIKSIPTRNLCMFLSYFILGLMRDYLGEGSWVTASDSKTNVAKVCKADITDSLQMVAMEIKDCAEFNFAEIAELN